jgi:hypothetical protein
LTNLYWIPFARTIVDPVAEANRVRERVGAEAVATNELVMAAQWHEDPQHP